MRILVADDEPIARQLLREHVESLGQPDLTIAGEAATGPEALQAILELRPDLVLLDLQMPGLDGLSVVRSLSGDHPPSIVFVTAFDQHAVEAFEVGAVDYLLKPVRRERLEKAIQKVRRQLEKTATRTSGPSRIAGRRGSAVHLLDPSEVIAFQAEGELVHIITASQRYLAGESLKELAASLDQPRFRRVHRSTIINSDHIRRISPLPSKRWLLVMSNGFEAVVSKRLGGSIRESTRGKGE